MTYQIDDYKTTDEQAEEHALQVLSQTEDNNDISTATQKLEKATDRAREILGVMWIKAVEEKDEATQAALIALDEQFTAASVTTSDVILLLNAARQTLSTIRDQRDAARAELQMLARDKDQMANEIASEMMDQWLTDPELFEEEQIQWLAQQIAENGLDYVREQEQNRLDAMLEVAADEIGYSEADPDGEFGPDEAEIIEDEEDPETEDDAA